MTGANYMGGRKNAAKARFKDPAARHQKYFFGRQKLNLLSKGGLPVSPGASHRGSDIGFSHARHRTTSTGQDGGEEGHIASPDKCFRPLNLSSDESARKSSKVLEALDTSGPMALRAAMDRILSLPDLAGLSSRSRQIKRSRDINHSEETSVKKRRISVSESEEDETRQNYSEYSPYDEYLPLEQENVLPASDYYYPHPVDRAERFGTLPVKSLTIPSFTGNIFDYDDPWKATGVLLGVEGNLGHTPKRTRRQELSSSSNAHNTHRPSSHLTTPLREQSSNTTRSSASVISHEPILAQRKRPLATITSEPSSHNTRSYNSIPSAPQDDHASADLNNIPFAMLDLPTSSPSSASAPSAQSYSEIPIALYSDEMTERVNTVATQFIDHNGVGDGDITKYYGDLVDEDPSEFSSWIDVSGHDSFLHPESFNEEMEPNERDASSWVLLSPTIAGEAYVAPSQAVFEDFNDEFSSWIMPSPARSAQTFPQNHLPFPSLSHLKSDDVFSVSMQNHVSRLAYLKPPTQSPVPFNVAASFGASRSPRSLPTPFSNIIHEPQRIGEEFQYNAPCLFTADELMDEEDED